MNVDDTNHNDDFTEQYGKNELSGEQNFLLEDALFQAEIEKEDEIDGSIFKMELQQLPNFSTAKILPETISLSSWIELIRSGGKLVEEFNKQRERMFVKKDCKNKSIQEYELFKKSLPVILYHSYCSENYKT